jgi:hypothetical protein
VEQRILEAAVVLPHHGGVTGWAALRWRKDPWFPGLGPTGLERPVTLAVAGDHIRPQPGIAMSHERLDPADLELVDGIRTTSSVRSAWFEMRYAVTATEAAVVLSMAAYSDLVSIDELVCFAAAHAGWTGAPRCREGFALAEENVWSPKELEVAIVWRVHAELPRLLCNRPLFERGGRFIGTPDLLDVEAGLAIDYDGERHRESAQRAADVNREERFRSHGLEYMSVLGPHLTRPGALAARMHQVRSRARFEPESRRTWTIEPPSWWLPSHTVELRRALSEAERQRALTYRIAA